MDLRTYVNSYNICCVNYASKDIINAWRTLYPELEIPIAFRDRNIRFRKGKFISFLTAPYREGDTYVGGTIECVITADDLLQNIEDNIDIQLDDIL